MGEHTERLRSPLKHMGHSHIHASMSIDEREFA